MTFTLNIDPFDDDLTVTKNIGYIDDEVITSLW